MTIKSILIAAAVAATGTAASADNYFQFADRLDDRSVLELGTVRAEADGVVEIYDFHKGELGELLGTEMVNAGANADVRINLGNKPRQDVIAVLKVDGQIVAERDYEIDQS